MNYATIKNCDIANGLGVRVSLFVSGCRHHCKNCFNEVAWDFQYGQRFTEETEDYLLSLLEPEYINGLSILGGEPMEPENQGPLLAFIKKVKEQYPQKDIWCYTGFTLEELVGDSRAHTERIKDLLSYIDVLVDGKFIDAKKDITLKFRGSSNQRLIDVKKVLSNSGLFCLINELLGNSITE